MAAEIPHALVRAVREVPIFSDLDDQTLLRIVGESANLLWPEGRTIFSVGDEAEALYIVLAGHVAIVEDAESGETPVAERGPGGYFGEQSLLKRTTHSKTVRTLEDTELMVLPRESFEALLDEDPTLAEKVRASLEERTSRRKA
jgi:CRP-like cAMP-binding protein